MFPSSTSKVIKAFLVFVAAFLLTIALFIFGVTVLSYLIKAEGGAKHMIVELGKDIKDVFQQIDDYQPKIK